MVRASKGASEQACYWERRGGVRGIIMEVDRMLTTGSDRRIIGNDQVRCPVWKSGLKRCSKNRKCTTIVEFWKGCLIEKKYVASNNSVCSHELVKPCVTNLSVFTWIRTSSINVTNKAKPNYDWSGNSIREFVNIWTRWGYIEFLLFVEVTEVKWRPLLSS